MTQHPIVPPPDKIHNWIQLEKIGWSIEQIIALAAQWGADTELEACCQVLYDRYDSVRHATGFPGSDMSDWLRAARRPNPLSLKEQALAILNDAHRGDLGDDEMATIRRALEQLPDHTSEGGFNG